MKCLERNPQLRTELYAELTRPATGSQALSLNYRWEQKDGKERAYIELIRGKEQRNRQRNEHCIRLYYVKITRDRSEVQQLVQEAARTVNRELTEGLASQPPGASFQGYYLIGERQEYCLGRIG